MPGPFREYRVRVVTPGGEVVYADVVATRDAEAARLGALDLARARLTAEVERADAPAPPRKSLAELFGADPGFTGGIDSVAYVREGRGAPADDDELAPAEATGWIADAARGRREGGRGR